MNEIEQRSSGQHLHPDGGPSATGRGQFTRLVGMLVALAVIGLVLESRERSDESSLMVSPLSTEDDPTAAAGSNLEAILDQLGYGSSTYPWPTPEAAPSSVVMGLSELDDERSYLSIVVDDADLHDPHSGLLTNPLERGRAWERVAYVSFFDAGELVWATRAGLRRHGGASRTRGQRASWRLYFRDEYGSDEARNPILSELPVAPPRLVVRRELAGYPNALGFALARHIGAVTPAFQPARVFVNGEDTGNHLVVEHVNPDGWGLSRFGHKNFSMFIHRGDSTDASRRRHRELSEWVDSTRPLRMAAVAERVDLDHLLRHLFTFMFSGTGDWAQGAAVLDHTDADARWFWLHWDLDHSFRTRNQAIVDRPGIGLVVEGDRRTMRNDVRARIFNRLRQEDPEFAGHFTALVTELLNHRLGRTFFDEWLGRYGHLLNRRSRGNLQRFFEQRPAALRAELSTYLGAGPSYQVSIEGPVDVALDVDGYAETGGYQGWYVEGTPVTVVVGDQADFSHWVVNGQRQEGRRLVVEVVETTSIRAVMRGGASTS